MPYFDICGAAHKTVDAYACQKKTKKSKPRVTRRTAARINKSTTSKDSSRVTSPAKICGTFPRRKALTEIVTMELEERVAQLEKCQDAMKRRREETTEGRPRKRLRKF